MPRAFEIKSAGKNLRVEDKIPRVSDKTTGGFLQNPPEPKAHANAQVEVPPLLTRTLESYVLPGIRLTGMASVLTRRGKPIARQSLLPRTTT
jgi:hypothetical protein